MKIFWVQKIWMILLSQQEIGEKQRKKREREKQNRGKTEEKERKEREKEQKRERERERKSNEGIEEWIRFPFIQIERDLIDDCEPFPSISFIFFLFLSLSFSFILSFILFLFYFTQIFFHPHFVLLSFLTIFIPFWPWIRINCMSTECNQQLTDLMMMTYKQIRTLLPPHYLLFSFLFLFFPFSFFFLSLLFSLSLLKKV